MTSTSISVKQRGLKGSSYFKSQYIGQVRWIQGSTPPSYFWTDSCHGTQYEHQDTDRHSRFILFKSHISIAVMQNWELIYITHTGKVVPVVN
jgi:hypothetical protein